MPFLQKKSKWNKQWVAVILSPLFVVISMLIFFRVNGLYPFGERSISWCDMDQQVVPLLLQFKDVLAGKEGFFLSFKNASGMNYFGVFFFFLASPFSLLIAFVDKADMLSFMNVLVMLKMAMTALTASLYFMSRERKNAFVSVTLSTLYAFSGYVMLYYQNVIWLDMVYLFPVLLLSLEKLKEGKLKLFVFALTACMVVNYYIGYMIVVFLLLYAFFETAVSGKEKNFVFATSFILGCALSALLSSVVWLPSLLQYFSSGRTSDIIQNLASSPIGTSYQTTYPTIFSVLFLLPFAIFGGVKTRKKVLLCMLVATLLPIFLEPVNKMWQTGSYMSFPTRYAFMTIFLLLALSYEGLLAPVAVHVPKPTPKKIKAERARTVISLKTEGAKQKYTWLPWLSSGIAFVLSVAFAVFAVKHTQNNLETMSAYSKTLWGNDESFKAFLTLYLLSMAVGVVWFVVKRTKTAKNILLFLGIFVLVLSETYVSPTVYMFTPSHEPDWFHEVVDLGERLEGDEFFRVKTDKDYSYHDFDANAMGGLGYNAIGHYTSLTDTDYMTAIKEWGYTSYWMEVGNSGGTILTDALLSVKYEISHQSKTGDIYSNTYYHVRETENYLPLGIVARGDIIEREKTLQTGEFRNRGKLQQTLYADFIGDDNGVIVLTIDDCVATDIAIEKTDNGRLRLTPNGEGAKLVFSVPVENPTALYFNVFDRNTNALKQGINGKFTVRTPLGTTSSFPTQKNNGLLPLGDFYSDTKVTLTLSSAVECSDISVIAIAEDKLSSGVNNVKTFGLQAEKNEIRGSFTSDGGECVFLSVPYNSGLTLKINGKKKELFRVYDGFCAFYTESGENEVTVSFMPRGFTAGCVLTGVGVVSSVAVLLFLNNEKFKTAKKRAEGLSALSLLFVGIVVIGIIYVAPMLLAVFL